LQPLSTESVLPETVVKKLKRQKGLLEIKTKKLENSFGSLKVKFTFAAAKNERVH
jgi:hypothetical protein